jgi:hypothetical protein
MALREHEMSHFKFFVFDKDNRSDDQLNVVFHKFREELGRDLYLLDPGSNLEMSATFKNSPTRYADIKTTLGVMEVAVKVQHRASENRLGAYEEAVAPGPS